MTDLQELNRAKLVSYFNKRIFGLLAICEKHCTDRSVISRVIKLTKVAKGIDHEVIIVNVGPYLFKYQQLIRERNIEAFSPEHMNQEVASATSGEKKADKYKEMAMSMFESIYSCLSTMTDTSGEDIYKFADELVDSYLQFCIRCRTEAK